MYKIIERFKTKEQGVKLNFLFRFLLFFHFLLEICTRPSGRWGLFFLSEIWLDNVQFFTVYNFSFAILYEVVFFIQFAELLRALGTVCYLLN